MAKRAYGLRLRLCMRLPCDGDGSAPVLAVSTPDAGLRDLQPRGGACADPCSPGASAGWNGMLRQP
eukprot:7337595-Alexandrium_andersonii.AAC.1